MIYYDSCYIAKYYLAEPDSERVQRKAAEAGAVACALHGKLETASVFHRKLREGGMTPSEYHLLRAQFEADSSNGLWSWLPLGTSLVDSSIRRLGIVQPDLFLRSADTLHLVCAADAGFEEIYSSDKHLLTAAPHFGLNGITL
jgi:predicted nucleic acid-binding protein